MGRITGRRAILLLVIVAMIFGLYGAKLYDMQVVDAEKNGDNATTYTIYTRVRAARGELLDTNGNKLVTNRASYDLHINHYVIQQADNTNDWLLELANLCKEMDVAYTDHFPVSVSEPFTYTLDTQTSTWKNYYQIFLKQRGVDSDVSASTLIAQLRKSYVIDDSWTDEQARIVIGLRYELTLRNLTNLSTYVLAEDVSEEFRTAVLALNFPGLSVEISSVREYSTQYAAHILGYIGKMNDSEMEQYLQLDGYEMDSLIGKTGLEQAFEEYLHGVDAIRVDRVTKDGTVLESHWKDGVAPQPGNNVEISVDLALQEAAEDKLAEVLDARREAGIDAEGGAVVAIDVKTGQVLVCGSYPTYDLSTVTTNWNELLTAEWNPLLNRALQGTYAPGSTYKVAMLIAGAGNGVVNGNTTYYDTGAYTVGNHTFKCMGVHHTINGSDALKVSCNCYFYWLADTIEQNYSWDLVDQTAKALGLGEYSGVELSERVGMRANADSKAEAYTGYDANWLRSDAVMAGIGQSVHSYTPIQLAVYASTLANKGVRNKATFLNRVVSANYDSLVLQNQVQILSKLTISDEVAALYLDGMKRVAQESGGTAYSTFKNYPISVAAKTGTAEGVGTSNGAFICFAPADDPQIAIAVYGEHVKGGSNLAPVAKAILDVYFGLESSETDNIENGLN